MFESKPGGPRRYPVEFPYTSLQSDIVEIELPGGYAVDEIPPPVDVSTAFGEYHSHCEVAGTILRYTRRYQINVLRVPAEQWGELRRFTNRIAADERSNAVLKQVVRRNAGAIMPNTVSDRSVTSWADTLF